MLYVWLISWVIAAAAIRRKTKSIVAVAGGGFLVSIFAAIVFGHIAGGPAKYAPDYETVVATTFPAAIRKRAELENDRLSITLKESTTDPTYFTHGDKINKILAIESIRLFYKLPQMDTLDLTLKLKSGTYRLDTTKALIEKHYDINIDRLREYDDNGMIVIGNKWRTEFLSRHGGKKSRRVFMKKFVSVKS